MVSKRTKILVLTTAVAAICFFWLEKSFLTGVSDKFPPNKNFEILNSVIRHIKNDYIDEADPRKTMEGAFRGLAGSLDVLSSYLDGPAAAKCADPQKLSFKDAGIIIFKRSGGFPVVVGLVENSSAEKAGIKIGDYVSALDDRSTLIQGLQEIIFYLKDSENKSVKLRLIRDNSTQEIKIDRADLYPKPLTFTALKGTSGIVKIHHFYPSLTADFVKSLLPKLKQEQRPIILDLRNCFEGDVAEAQKFLNVFIKADKIGYFEKKGAVKEYLGCPDNAELEKSSLIIWANQATMGPAEIVAAVLKDFKKARIVGIQTPGLTARQDLYKLENGDALLLTTGIFFLNSGEKLWEKGVAPDVKLEFNEQDQKSYEEKTLGLISR